MIQRRALAGLLRAYLLIDLRKQMAGTGGKGPPGPVTPLTLIVWQLLLGSALVAGVLFARVDVAFFTAVTTAFALLMTALVIVPELPHLMHDPADESMLGARPVTEVTIRLAHLVGALLHGALVMLALALVPAILGAGMPDAGPWYFPVYLGVTMGLGSLLVTALLAPGACWQDRPWFQAVQIAPMLLVVIGAQLLFKNRETHPVELLAYRAHEWVEHAPTAGLARFVVEASREPFTAAVAAGAGILLVGILVLAGVPLASPRRPTVRESAPSAVRATREVDPGAHPHERASARMARRLMERDPAYGSALLPYATMIATLAAVAGFNGQLGDPFVARGERVAGSFLTLYGLGLVLPPLYHVLGTSRDHAAAWIFLTAPLDGPSRLRRGLRREVARRFLAPAVALGVLAFTILWRSPGHALVHGAIAGGVLLGVSFVTDRCFAGELPFSRVPVRFEAVVRHILGQAALTTALALLAGVHYLALGGVAP